MRYLLFLILASLLHAAPDSPPPQTITLPDTLAVSATSSRLSAGEPDESRWLYVVWQPSDPLWMKNRALGIYVKTGSLASTNAFTLMGRALPATDPAACKVWMTRAQAAGEREPTLRDIANELVDEYRPAGQTVPDGTPERFAMLVNKSLGSEQAGAALRQVSRSHPAVRCMMGLGWMGQITQATGTLMTVEVREVDPATGADRAVVGRVEFTAGTPTVLPAPGAPVQVPDLTAEGHMLVKLRWSIPDALRRKSLETPGFYLFRVPAAATLADPPTFDQLRSAGARTVNRSPILASKLFTAAEAVNFTTDPATFFIADDGQRLTAPAFRSGAPVWNEGDRWKYYVAATDWMGQLGTISSAGVGALCKTIPPLIPQPLASEQVLVREAGVDKIRFRLRFKMPPTTAGDTPAEQYAVYRVAGDTADSLSRRDFLTPQPPLPLVPPDTGVAPLAIFTPTGPNAPDAQGVITWTDTLLAATTAADFAKTYWYSIRAIHDLTYPHGAGTADDVRCGPIYSPPSPPVFATFHDRQPPAPPTGARVEDCPEPIIRAEGTVDVAQTISSPGKGRWLRLRLTRTDVGKEGIAWAQFTTYSARTQSITAASPRVYFGAGTDEVWHDVFWDQTENSLSITAWCGSADGAASFKADQTVSFPGISTTVVTVAEFSARLVPLHAMDGSTGRSASFTPAATFTNTALGSVQYTLPGGVPSNATVLRTVVSGGTTVDADLSRAVGGSVTFPAASPPVGATTTFRYILTQQTTMPPGHGTPWPPPRPSCAHQIIPVNGRMTPVLVQLFLTSGTKEYRIYRQINNGPLSLISSAPADYDSGALKAVVTEDFPNLPTAGRVCYFGQTVDEHGNVSALAPLGDCLEISPPVPVPVLNTPEAGGTLANPKMILRWFCQKEGVRRFIISVSDTKGGEPTLISSALSAKLSVSAAKVISTPPGGGTPQPGNIETQWSTNTAILPPTGANPPAELPVHVADFNVQEGVEYRVEVWAEDNTGKAGLHSIPQLFTWRAAPAAGEVPWPARPLPEVLDGALIGIGANQGAGPSGLFMQARANESLLAGNSRYPVCIPVGFMPGTTDTLGTTSVPPRTRLARLTLNTLSSLALSNAQPIRYLFRLPSAEDGSVRQANRLVLYRRMTHRDGIDVGFRSDVVQAGPLVDSIAYVANTATLSTFLDPYVDLLPVMDGTIQAGALLCLTDQLPAVQDCTYAYYVVKFSADGEIEAVIDAGSATIN